MVTKCKDVSRNSRIYCRRVRGGIAVFMFRCVFNRQGLGLERETQGFLIGIFFSHTFEKDEKVTLIESLFLSNVNFYIIKESPATYVFYI